MKLTPTFMSTLDVHFDRTLFWLQTFSTAINYTNSHFVRSNSHTCSLAHTSQRAHCDWEVTESSDTTDQINISPRFTMACFTIIDRSHCTRPTHTTNRATEGAIIMTDFGLKVFPNIFVVFISIAFSDGNTEFVFIKFSFLENFEIRYLRLFLPFLRPKSII